MILAVEQLVENDGNFGSEDIKPVAAVASSQSNNKAVVEKDSSTTGPIVRPSIELDESSTEHEYHVSPSSENVSQAMQLAVLATIF